MQKGTCIHQHTDRPVGTQIDTKASTHAIDALLNYETVRSRPRGGCPAPLRRNRPGGVAEPGAARRQRRRVCLSGRLCPPPTHALLQRGDPVAVLLAHRPGRRLARRRCGPSATPGRALPMPTEQPAEAPPDGLTEMVARRERGAISSRILISPRRPRHRHMHAPNACYHCIDLDAQLIRRRPAGLVWRTTRTLHGAW